MNSADLSAGAEIAACNAKKDLSYKASVVSQKFVEQVLGLDAFGVRSGEDSGSGV
jgi:hypothetical protein